jgi:transposase
MSTPKKLLKEFDSKYNSPAMRLNLEEQGWKYMGQKNNKPIYKIIY